MLKENTANFLCLQTSKVYSNRIKVFIGYETFTIIPPFHWTQGFSRGKAKQVFLYQCLCFQFGLVLRSFHR